MKKDVQGGGTNADGSKSAKFCSHCFEKGQFTLPDITADRMQARVKGKLREMGFPGFLAARMAWGIPKLERWKPQGPGAG